MARVHASARIRSLTTAAMTVGARMGIGSRSRYVLETTDPKTGEQCTTPVSLVEYSGRRWLVARCGDTGWVGNVREQVTVELSRGRRTWRVYAAEAEPAIAAPILWHCLQGKPRLAPYFHASLDDGEAAFIAEAARHPVFKLSGKAGAPTWWRSRAERTSDRAWAYLMLIVVFAAALVFWSVHGMTLPQATVVTGLVVLVSAGLAWFQSRESRLDDRERFEAQQEGFSDQLRLQGSVAGDERARETLRELRTAFTAACAQLGAETSVVRLAGVYALTNLADDWIELSNEIDTLDGIPSPYSRVDPMRQAQQCIDVLCAYLRAPVPGDIVAGHQVREAITQVIMVHLQNRGTSTSWSNRTFDFTGAYFSGTHHFDDIELNQDCWMILAGVTFGPESTITFTGARFNEGCLLDLSDSRFEGGCMASFGPSTFNTGCRVDLSRVTLDPLCWMSLQGVTFAEGCFVDFSHTTLATGCGLDFGNAAFDRGCRVELTGVETATPGQIHFEESVFNDGQPTGPWGSSEPPPHWPIGVGA